MDIDGLSIQTMLRFMNAGFIHEFADIFRLKEHFGEISQMEGFGEKSVEFCGICGTNKQQRRKICVICNICEIPARIGQRSVEFCEICGTNKQQRKKICVICEICVTKLQPK